MVSSLVILASFAAFAVAAPAGNPAPAPAPTLAPQLGDLDRRATSCTFTDADSASKSKASCATIVLSNIAVPSGSTLDMTDLNDNTAVC